MLGRAPRLSNRLTTVSLKSIKAGYALGAAALLVAGCGSGSSSAGGAGSSIDVSESTWHDGQWPFTVSQGVLGCAQPPFPGAVTFNVDGTLYGLNGTAQDGGDAAPDPIWKKVPGGLRVDIGPMIDKGLSLCPK